VYGEAIYSRVLLRNPHNGYDFIPPFRATSLVTLFQADGGKNINITTEVLLLLLRALQSVMCLGLFYNYSPFVPTLGFGLQFLRLIVFKSSTEPRCMIEGLATRQVSTEID
jgi:hypothetical protein